MSLDEKIVEFPKAEPPISPEERVRRQMVEAERLANLSPGEWMLWIDGSAEQLGISRDTLKRLVKEKLKERERKEREAKAEQERQRKQQEQKQERQRRERAKEFTKIAKLPRAETEKQVASMAKREGMDEEELVTEFTEAVGDETSAPGRETWQVEPWPEPVDTAALLDGISKKIRKHTAMLSEQAISVSLWVAYDWIHHLTTHSTFLVPMSEDESSGKTTLMSLLGYMVKKPFSTVEPTGPTIYRTIDAYQPTFIVDEAGNLFARKSDVWAIINASWTRGYRITRGGYDFDPYCPKIIGAKGRSKTKLPIDFLSRCLVIVLFPAKPGEIPEKFRNCDDDELVELRRKAARWANDNAETVAKTKPTFPPGFSNRLEDNWELLLAIAEHAGNVWAKQARDAAVLISRGAYEPSWGVRLLAEMDAMFQEQLSAGKVAITSAALERRLLADPLSPWHDYKGGLTQRKIAALLKAYGIKPTNVHPTGSSHLTLRGYMWTECREMLARYRDRFTLVETQQPPQKRHRNAKSHRASNSAAS
jgi:putative DNA primase/helicase